MVYKQLNEVQLTKKQLYFQKNKQKIYERKKELRQQKIKQIKNNKNIIKIEKGVFVLNLNLL